jgi:hypothetical protein
MKKIITKIVLLTLSLSTISRISLTNYVSSPQKNNTSFVSSFSNNSNNPHSDLNFIDDGDNDHTYY